MDPNSDDTPHSRLTRTDYSTDFGGTATQATAVEWRLDDWSQAGVISLLSIYSGSLYVLTSLVVRAWSGWWMHASPYLSRALKSTIFEVRANSHVAPSHV